MSKVSDLHEKWSQDPDYRRGYDELGPEFEIVRFLTQARIDAELTQALHHAPYDVESETEEELKTADEAWQEYLDGKARPLAELREELTGDG